MPLNAGGVGYTVLVPAGSSISYLGGIAGTIDSLSFGSGSVLDLSEGSRLEVSGVAIIRGLVQVDGAGSVFRASGDQVGLEGFPRFPRPTVRRSVPRVRPSTGRPSTATRI